MDEVIRWNLVTESLPDEGMVVLLSVPDSADNVWLGELDEGDWRWVNGSKVAEEVVAWAEMPVGLEVANCGK